MFPRLCLLQFYLSEKYKDAIGPLVAQLIQKDKEEAVPDYIPPAKRRKKMKHTSSHVVCLTPNQMWKLEDEMDINKYYNHASLDRSLYTKFTEQILTEDNIKWRFHDESVYSFYFQLFILFTRLSAVYFVYVIY